MKTPALFAALAVALLTTASLAQTVEVKRAWARATVQGQKASGAYMQLIAKDQTQLVSMSSPLVGVAEVHQMKMDGDVMKMRAVQGGLELPAGKSVELKPGGYHVMLMDLKKPLLTGTILPLTLVFKDSKGVEFKTELKIPVRSTAPASGHMDH